MATITISLHINAPLPVVFDLCRSIDMHMVSTEGTGEKAIDGVKSGLIEAGQTVTWQARHLLRTRKFKTIITAMEPYRYFRDEMAEGDFRSFYHEHYFEENDGFVIMKDVLHLEAPYGLVGRFVMRIF
ncbi:MAG: SRPBCC family protein [Ferruginibacter sp.]